MNEQQNDNIQFDFNTIYLLPADYCNLFHVAVIQLNHNCATVLFNFSYTISPSKFWSESTNKEISFLCRPHGLSLGHVRRHQSPMVRGNLNGSESAGASRVTSLNTVLYEASLKPNFLKRLRDAIFDSLIFALNV